MVAHKSTLRGLQREFKSKAKDRTRFRPVMDPVVFGSVNVEAERARTRTVTIPEQQLRVRRMEERDWMMAAYPGLSCSRVRV